MNEKIGQMEGGMYLLDDGWNWLLDHGWKDLGMNGYFDLWIDLNCSAMDEWIWMMDRKMMDGWMMNGLLDDNGKMVEWIKRID